MSVSNQGKIVRNKVLVTGASGLLGVAAIEKFLSADWEVVGVSRRKPERLAAATLTFCRSICGTRKEPAPRSSR
jgi:NAD(P)-dependent dehydrogenase (short-subunit alcohol dehydrogenase family)